MTKKLYKHIGIFIDKVCTGTEKSTKKEDFSVLEKFITHLIPWLLLALHLKNQIYK